MKLACSNLPLPNIPAQATNTLYMTGLAMRHLLVLLLKDLYLRVLLHTHQLTNPGHKQQRRIPRRCKP
jgi:hypothetical protein